ncbi:MAG: hypothetical protein ACR2HP_19065 [Ilumatobacteraceae bacterium]
MIFAAACGEQKFTEVAEEGTGERAAVAIEGGSARLPFETLTDWVSYGDAVILGTVTAETEIPPTAEAETRGEGLIGRALTVTVDEIIWQHPTSEGAPAEFSFTGYPWELRSGERIQTVSVEAGWLEVGRQYLLAVTKYEPDGWGPINPSTALPVADGVIQDVEGTESSFELELAGADTVTARSRIEEADPDPTAEQYRELDPDAQWQAVVSERDPGPGAGELLDGSIPVPADGNTSLSVPD